MMHLSDDDLRVRLLNFEDSSVERKVASDVGDVTKVAVSFANSLPIGVPGVIFIPAKNDGTIQAGPDLDQLQKKVTERLNRAYPPIPSASKIVRVNGDQVIATIVWGSESRPHFSGRAYVRKGSESVEASEEMFRALIAQRTSKVYEILRWKDQKVHLHVRQQSPSGWMRDDEQASILECNEFYLSLRGDRRGFYSVPLSKVELSFHDAAQCLFIEVTA